MRALFFNCRLTGYVVDLDLVLEPASDGSSAGGSVAVVLSIVQVRSILELLLQRKLVERLAKGELPVDSILRDAIVDDIEEPLRTDCLDECIGQLGIPLSRSIFG